MSTPIEELDYRATDLGTLILRRRRPVSLDEDVYEVKLDGEFLMSSLVNESERALANIALPLVDAPALDVIVGGLGLGYTAKAALDRANVRSVRVIEFLAPVIDWHRRGLVPLAETLTSDPRCRLTNGDCFGMLSSEQGPNFDDPDKQYHAILIDIDHSPTNLLDASHAAYYEPDGLRLLTRHLAAGGIFALWSGDPPDEDFAGTLDEVFTDVESHRIEFRNPLLDLDDLNTIYTARKLP